MRARDLLERLLCGYDERYAALKRRSSALDFEDLELLSRELLREDTGCASRYRARFERVMVDEFQDTNAVQLELIDAVSSGNLFTVGDAQQSIYGVPPRGRRSCSQRRGELAAAAAARDAAHELPLAGRRSCERELGRALGSSDPAAAPGPRRSSRSASRAVELLIADKGASWAIEGPATPWRVAEARALARRIGSCSRGGAVPRDIVVLLRATADMRAYERALEERGVPTYVIGGRGYWSHPQVVDLVSYLRALANPRDEVALYSVLASPLVGASAGRAGAARRGVAHQRPQRVVGLEELLELLDEVRADDRVRLDGSCPGCDPSGRRSRGAGWRS